MTVKINIVTNELVARVAFLLILAAYFSSTCNAEQDLADTLSKLKPGIVAVGTYMPKRNPRAVFLATGFAVGDGSLIVTNWHVIPEQIGTWWVCYHHIPTIIYIVKDIAL
jgi:hypothetical protein